MSLRTKLLLLSLLTLILPWAGWQYAQQMETTLRRGQEDALLTTAQVLSRVVASEPELLYRVPDLRREFDPHARRLVRAAPRDAPAARRLRRRMAAAGACSAGLRRRRPRRGRRRTQGAPRRVSGDRCTCTSKSRSRRCATKSRRATKRAPAGKSDRVIVLTHDEFGHERAWSISAIAPGPLLVRVCEIGAPWKPSADEVPYVEGRWRETGKGYAIELRAPLNLFGTQLAVQALDARRCDRRADARARVDSHWLGSAEAAAGAVRTGWRARFGRRHARLAAGACRFARSHDADAVSRDAARR